MCTNVSDKTNASILSVRWYLSTKLYDIPSQKTASSTVNAATTPGLTYYSKIKSHRKVISPWREDVKQTFCWISWRTGATDIIFFCFYNSRLQYGGASRVVLSPDITRVIKSTGMRWQGHVARTVVQYSF